ncbi:guanine nucleotide-binding protein G(o) subunit alpha [Ixodes scapularis]|uniref:Heterotrimeric G protein alpha subunit B, putative n=2 Tax=Ixodes TaxID=6944 RepID=B7P7J1_IXOSC|nr:guanine nucleotide-binding protein G(o) subunit alpha [Ixodes scapularis]EEC02563.1 heterotrimeric G protein alpha subunit B, putative [Ixodes scapularis]|eukprot:XP_002399234.1 heterotrimeric G protein alpha subunit B, putative [Ixodes scapularis]
MGACLSQDEEERRARLRSSQIDRQIAELARQERNVIKILLLGAGESGKSTIVKQMKIIHNEGFSDEELRSFRPTVLDNLLGSMKFVLTGMGILRINLENPKNKAYAQTVLGCQCCFDEGTAMLPFVGSALKNLWNDKGIRLAAARGFEYELNDSALYLFENMDRICSEKYVPSPRDVLRARVRTNGIIETHFKIDDIVFRMFDVGGQRSERRKWIQCFDDVKALLYVVALSGYDMTLQEDPSVNRLQESLKLFASICNNMFFTDTSLVLFLNKLDLFRDKILYSERHLRYYLPDYKGPDYDVDSGALFIQHRFQSRNRDPGKLVYPHFTTATDTSNVQVVFQVAMDTVLRGNLKTATLL